jgi:hypothetical protein
MLFSDQLTLQSRNAQYRIAHADFFTPLPKWRPHLRVLWLLPANLVS